MGRYDKIKVYNNNAWRAPSKIRVYQNGWQDLGDSNSSNTQTLYVQHNNEFKRATLNKKTTTRVTDSWATGGFSVLPLNGYNSRPDAGYKFAFSIDNMRHTNGVDSNIFTAHNDDWSSYIQITWLSDGRVRFKTCYNKTTRETISNNAVGLNQSVGFACETYMDNGVARQALSFNGVWSGGQSTSMMSHGSFPNTVGDGNIQFRGTMRVRGSSYVNGTISPNYREFNTSSANGSDGYNYSGVTHHENPTTTVTWE